MSGRAQDGQEFLETLSKGAADREWFMRYEIHHGLRWDPDGGHAVARTVSPM